MAEKKSSCFGCIGKSVILVVGLLVVAFLLDPTGEKAAKQKEVTEQQAANKAAQLEAEKPLGSAARAEHEIRKAVPGRALRFTESNGDVTVEFDIGDNLTDNMVKSGAELDCADILKAIVKSQLQFDQVEIFGNHELQDKFGKVTNTRVVEVLFLSSTAAKINWDNFISSDLYSIADSLTIHPAFVVR